MPRKVFISYRRDDSKYQARMIHAAFCRSVPRDHVFMDIDSIPPGANFRKILKDWVDQCEVLLALIGPGWIDATDPRTGRRRLDNASDFVRIEIGEALARDIPVVPVLLDGTPMPDPDHLPDDLKELVDRQAEFVEYRTFDPDVERLIRKLRLGLTGRPNGKQTPSEFVTELAAGPPQSTPPNAAVSKGPTGALKPDGLRQLVRRRLWQIVFEIVGLALLFGSIAAADGGKSWTGTTQALSFVGIVLLLIGATLFFFEKPPRNDS